MTATQSARVYLLAVAALTHCCLVLEGSSQVQKGEQRWQRGQQGNKEEQVQRQGPCQRPALPPVQAETVNRMTHHLTLKKNKQNRKICQMAKHLWQSP